MEQVKHRHIYKYPTQTYQAKTKEATNGKMNLFELPCRTSQKYQVMYIIYVLLPRNLTFTLTTFTEHIANFSNLAYISPTYHLKQNFVSHRIKCCTHNGTPA